MYRKFQEIYMSKLTLHILWLHGVETGLKTISWQQMHINSSSTFDRNICLPSLVTLLHSFHNFPLTVSSAIQSLTWVGSLYSITFDFFDEGEKKFVIGEVISDFFLFEPFLDLSALFSSFSFSCFAASCASRYPGGY